MGGAGRRLKTPVRPGDLSWRAICGRLLVPEGVIHHMVLGCPWGGGRGRATTTHHPRHSPEPRFKSLNALTARTV